MIKTIEIELSTIDILRTVVKKCFDLFDDSDIACKLVSTNLLSKKSFIDCIEFAFDRFWRVDIQTSDYEICEEVEKFFRTPLHLYTLGRVESPHVPFWMKKINIEKLNYPLRFDRNGNLKCNNIEIGEIDINKIFPKPSTEVFVVISIKQDYEKLIIEAIEIGAKIILVDDQESNFSIRRFCQSLGLRFVFEGSNNDYDVVCVQVSSFSKLAHIYNRAISFVSFEHSRFLNWRLFVLPFGEKIEIENVEMGLSEKCCIISASTWLKMGGFQEFLSGERCFYDMKSRIKGNELLDSVSGADEANEYIKKFGRTANYGKVPGKTTICEKQDPVLKIHEIETENRHEATLIKSVLFSKYGYFGNITYDDGQFVVRWIADKRHDFFREYKCI